MYTNNYPEARLEIILLEGKINQKISNQIFIATLPADIKKEDLSYSTPDKPDTLEDISIQAIQRWKRTFSFDYFNKKEILRIPVAN